MEGLKPILERRSCRTYTDQPVPEHIIETLLKAGMFAPSANNAQPWEFLVMQDAEKKEAASNIAPYWSMLKNAPLGILVLADVAGYRGPVKDYFIQDCSASTENILIAAEAMGLGGVWLGLYPREDRIKKIRAIYNIPGHIMPFSVVSLGYPDKPHHPHTTYHAEKVHRDVY